MECLLVILLSIAFTSAEIYNLEAIQRQDNELSNNGQYKFDLASSSRNMPQLRNYDGTFRGGYPFWDNNGRVKYMEYITNPKDYDVYGSYLPMTVAPVTDTPEVKAARKAHEKAYNYLRSIGSSLQHPEYKNNVPVTTSTPFYSQLESTTILPVTFKSPLKNYYKTIEVTKTQLGETDAFQASQDSPYYFAQNSDRSKNSHSLPSVPSIDNMNNYKSSEKQLLSKVRTLPKLTPEEHLRALKKVIAEQLRSYVNRPSEIAQEKDVNELDYYSDYKTNPSSSIENEEEIERNRKIAVLAAARSLLKILKEGY